MILVVGVFEVAPGDRELFVASRHSQVLAARAEPGCLDYAFSLDALSPGTVRLIESWSSDADFAAHVAAMTAAGGPASSVAVISRSVHVYDAVVHPT